MGNKFAALGDSLTRCTNYGGVTTEDSWVYKVGRGLGYAPEDIINAGTGGNTALEGFVRIVPDVTSKGKGVCCVMFGANDVQQNVDIEAYANSLRDIARHLKNEGWACVFASWPMWRGNSELHTKYRRYLETFRSVAGEFGIGFIDILHHYAFDYLCNEAEFNARYVDSVHQTKAGNSWMSTILLGMAYRKYWALPQSIPTPNPQPDPEPQPQPTGATELQLACEDLTMKGATVERLTRVIAAINGQ